MEECGSREEQTSWGWCRLPLAAGRGEREREEEGECTVFFFFSLVFYTFFVPSDRCIFCSSLLFSPLSTHRYTKRTSVCLAINATIVSFSIISLPFDRDDEEKGQRTSTQGGRKKDFLRCFSLLSSASSSSSSFFSSFFRWVFLLIFYAILRTTGCSQRTRLMREWWVLIGILPLFSLCVSPLFQHIHLNTHTHSDASWLFAVLRKWSHWPCTIIYFYCRMAAKARVFHLIVSATDSLTMKSKNF